MVIGNEELFPYTWSSYKSHWKEHLWGAIANTRMHIYTHTHVNSTRTHISTHTSTHTHTYTRSRIHTCTHACTYIHTCRQTYIHLFLYICIRTYIYTSTHTCIMYIHMYINAHRHTRTSIYVCMCVCVLMICLWIIKSHVFFPHGYVFIYRQVHIARRRALLISILLMIYSKQYLPGESVDTWLVKKYIYSLILTLIQWRAEPGDRKSVV